jgi:hypothetical protein
MFFTDVGVSHVSVVEEECVVLFYTVDNTFNNLWKLVVICKLVKDWTKHIGKHVFSPEPR